MNIRDENILSQTLWSVETDKKISRNVNIHYFT